MKCIYKCCFISRILFSHPPWTHTQLLPSPSHLVRRGNRRVHISHVYGWMGRPLNLVCRGGWVCPLRPVCNSEWMVPLHIMNWYWWVYYVSVIRVTSHVGGWADKVPWLTSKKQLTWELFECIYKEIFRNKREIILFGTYYHFFIIAFICFKLNLYWL